MSIKALDKTIKREYRSLIDNVVQSFYIPLLGEAVIYRRAVGFFSSTALAEISKGISQMAQKGGHIQIVASPYLSEEDIKAISEGYERREKIIENALLRELSGENIDYYSLERLNLLACLIADGVLDIRIAFTENHAGIGMYHEKMGIIKDADGHTVAFSGSMNESSTAMSINYETIDVFCDWRNESDADRVRLKENAFTAIWNNTEPNISVLEFPGVKNEIIKRYKRKKPNFEIDKEQFGEINIPENTEETRRNESKNDPEIPNDLELFDYQKEAISEWVGENYRGIFDMATGTGKTLTGLAAISKCYSDCSGELAVIIVCPFQHLVEQWVEDIVRFNIKPIIAYSASPQKDWKKRFEKAILDQRVRSDKKFFCVICTNAMFTSKFVQDQINKVKTKTLLVVDEAHNFGARGISSLLDDRFTYRLALSATIERHRDEEGTALLLGYFGRKCIEYPLEKAIKENKLTPYKYYPVVVNLNENELNAYEQYSYEMSKCVIRGKDGRYKLNKHGEMLAIKRSQIVAGAVNKLDALRDIVKSYKEDNNMLFYCGATKVLEDRKEETEIDDADIRQIEAVVGILGNEFNMEVAKFTSEENMETRNVIKDQFLKGDRLQAIVAIKCLDEGFNIPGIRTAFILASSTNPKEYIQRRGRVLRKAEGKQFAVIYDFITLPRPLDEVSALTTEQARRDLSLIRNELNRLKEFSCVSMNSMNSKELIWQIEEAYHLNEDDYYEESEDGHGRTEI